MLKEQLGSVSESEHKTLPVTTLEQCRYLQYLHMLLKRACYARESKMHFI